MAVHIALDVGKETIGLAACDAEEDRVRPLYTLTRIGRKKDVARVVDEIRRVGAEVVVVGLARLKSGDEGESAARARLIGGMVGDRAGLPVVYQDEHLSTFEAEERLRARGFHGEPLKIRLDAEAAKVILEDYLRARRR